MYHTHHQPALVAERLFKGLQFLTFAVAILGGIAAAGSWEAIQALTGSSAVKAVWLAFLPVGNLIFFALFFRWLSDLFKGMKADSIFNSVVSLANKRLMWLCIANLVFFIAQTVGNHAYDWLLDPQYTALWVQQLFVAALATVFYFNSRVFSAGQILQAEQDLTV